MIKILVAGGLESDDPRAEEFLKGLGRAIISNGHILLNECESDFDCVIASGAEARIEELALDPLTFLKSYVLAGSAPRHRLGTILKSQRPNRGLSQPDLTPPEEVGNADVVIMVGGGEEAMRVANWARILDRPLLPVTLFGGTAEAEYAVELASVETRYSGRIKPAEFEVLNQFAPDPTDLACEVLALAEGVVASKSVFVVMSFSGAPSLEDAYESFVAVCHEFEYECVRVDISTMEMDRLIPEILTRIRHSAFVIADLTELRPNVLYELGIAHGCGRQTIVTAQTGTKLPFDVTDVPVTFWEGQKQLKERLRERIRQITSA